MNTHPTPKVLVVEDDPSIRSLLEFHLKEAGYAVDLSGDGADGMRKALDNPYDLLILDLMIPKGSGLEICQRVQTKIPRPLTLILTSRSEEYDKVLGLNLGADDYLTKPFGITELLARVRALLRRLESSAPQKEEGEIRQIGPLLINKRSRQVLKANEKVELTATEFDLLWHLASHAGKAFSREQLLNSVWGYSYEGYEHTVNSHINRLRGKIERDPNAPQFIETVRGVGYRCVETFVE